MKHTRLFKNFFTDNELLELKIYAENLFSKSKGVDITSLTWDQIYTHVKDIQIDKYMGRVQLTLPPSEYPDYIVNKLSEAAKSIDPECKIRYFSFVKYSLEHGQPQLMPHMDNPKRESFLFDIQLDANIDWPIVVDGKEYVLQNNDILVIDVQREVHWRKPIKFNEDSYVYMMFVSFNNDNLELPIESEQQKKAAIYVPEYNKQLKDIYPDNYAGVDGSKWKEIRKK
jgi:hypothetical protein